MYAEGTKAMNEFRNDALKDIFKLLTVNKLTYTASCYTGSLAKRNKQIRYMFNFGKSISDSVTFRPVWMCAQVIEANREELT